MSDQELQQEQTSNSQIIMIALVVIAALLAAIVGVLIWQQSQASKAAVPVAAPATQPGAPAGMGAQPGAPAGMGGAPAGMGGGGAAAPVDPASATKVPKGVEPEAFVKGYYVACDKGDWKAAYDALPADKKAGQTPEGLQQQVEGYAVKSFKVTGAEVSGDKAVVKADQVTGSYGTFENTWTFVKKDGVWMVESKAVSGMRP